MEGLLHEKESQVHSLELHIHQVDRSIPMQLVRRYQKIVDRLLRPGTRRRHHYDLALTGVRVILNEGWKSFFRKSWHRITHRPLAIGKPHRDLPQFNASVLKKDVNRIVFPVPSDKPEVTIVIPAYNQLVYTLNCLMSIAENTDADYEVVVVDDASKDETAEVLSGITNLRLVTNEQNFGFVESCNRGASAGRGNYILFLNNDTMVTKGWLPPLLELIRKEHVGAVGSKLVYSDGTLQEAGGIIWRDGSGWNYGRGDDPDRPEYSYVREVDYCSGASLIVRSDLFERSGGFDERFKPGYGEDADLCLTFRHAGYSVMYQPMSVVVHFEGVTCGRSTSTGPKRYQEINRHKLAEKWITVLDRHHYSPAAENAFVARNRTGGRSILLVDHYVPTRDMDAGSLWVFNILSILSDLGNRVTFIGDNLLRLEPYTSELQQLGVEVIYSPYVWSVTDYVRQSGKHFDVVFLSRTHVSIKYVDLLRRTSGRSKIVYLTHELTSISELRRGQLAGDREAVQRAQRIGLDELHVARNSDCTIAVSPVEKRELLAKDPSLTVEVLSSIYDITAPQKSFSQRDGMLFVGGFNHPPNVDGITHFASDCFPLIEQESPDIHLYVVGSDPPEEVLALRSQKIEVTGYVDDLAPYFESCRVFVAPLRYGAGVKGKVVQSMAHGVPVVTTAIGAEGLDLVDGENALIADDPREFADKVVLLCSDETLWYKLSRNSMSHAQNNFSYRVAKEKLGAILSQWHSQHDPR